MNKWLKISIIASVVLLFAALVYYFGRADRKDYVSDTWEKTFEPSDKGPYGTFVLKELLDTNGLFGNFIDLNTPIEKGLVDNEDVNDIYFYIGESSYLPDSSCEYLLNFVSEGNTAFFSAQNIPYGILTELMYETDQLFEESPVIDSVQYFKFTHPDLASRRYETPYIFRNEKMTTDWFYLNNDYFELYGADTSFVLGKNSKEKINFLKIKYGYGEIYLHSTPYHFTNVAMFKRKGFNYVENILAHIPPGRVQWDRYNLDPHYASEDDENENSGGEPRESILQFILENPPLLWGAILLVMSGLLLILFNAKREQRVLPAKVSKENTSLEYISTLSSLYLQQKRHNKLVNLKRKTFLNFIADHYYITCKEPDAIFFEKVAMKSQVPLNEVVDIFGNFDRLDNDFEVSDDSLILLHKKIEKFYKKCK